MSIDIHVKCYRLESLALISTLDEMLMTLRLLFVSSPNYDMGVLSRQEGARMGMHELYHNYTYEVISWAHPLVPPS